MFSKVLLIALAASPLVAAHGKIAVATGDAGGNGTAFGIQGAVIPGPGKNKVTEPDTTVFKGKAADACGRTNGQGNNDPETGTAQAMALSGSTLPQVTPGGSVSGTVHVVTTDGFGPYTAMLNTDGTAQTWTEMEVVQQVPGGTKGNGNGKQGEFAAQQTPPAAGAAAAVRSLFSRMITKRATNVNEDYAFQVKMPADATCTGTMAGQANTCIVKMVNPSKAGPFGGCIPVQMAQAGAAPAAGAATARRAAAFSA